MDLRITSNNNINYKNIKLSFKSANNKTKSGTNNINSNHGYSETLGMAAVSALIIGGIAFASGKNNIPSHISAAIKAADECRNIAAAKSKQVINLAVSLQKKVDEVCAIFKNGGKDSTGTIVGKIIPNTDSKILAENFLEEYSQKGELLRRSSFMDDFLVKIEEFTDNGKNKNILKHNWFEGGIESYTEGYRKLADGSEDFTKKIQFHGGPGNRIDSPYSIHCTYNEKLDPAGTKNTELEITGGSVKHYFEGYSKNTETNQLEIGRGLWLKYEEPDIYVENNTISKNSLENIAKELNFKDGKPVKCTFNSREAEGVVTTAPETWELQDDIWMKIT